MNRRDFLKSLSALCAAPIIAKIPDVSANANNPIELKPVQNLVIPESFYTNPNIGGLYKDGELIAAFSAWEVTSTANSHGFIHNSGGITRIPSFMSYEGEGELLEINDSAMVTCNERYNVKLFNGEIIMTMNDVIIVQKIISLDELNRVHVSFNSSNLKYS